MEARQVEEKRGCSSFTGCISKGARVLDACGLLIATRLDALSRVHTSWDTCWTGEWMDRRVTKIGSRIRQGARGITWSQMMRNRFAVCVCVYDMCAYRDRYSDPRYKNFPFQPVPPLFLLVDFHFYSSLISPFSAHPVEFTLFRVTEYVSRVSSRLNDPYAGRRISGISNQQRIRSNRN